MNIPGFGSDEGARPALWIGAAGALVAALAGMLGFHDASLWRMPAALEERTATALQTAGFAGLEVDMRGQRAVLSGIAESEDDIAAAAQVALTSAGGGGPWAGGVTSVDTSGVAVGPFERPFSWSVRREGVRVVLSGAVPSESARSELMRTAGGAFANLEAVDDMHVAGGAPSAYFTDVAASAVRAVARLETGEARIVDSQVVIIGDGRQQGVDAANALFADPPSPFRVRMAVTIDGLDVAHPELQGLNLASGGAETCDTAFERLMERNVINFASGSAAIEPSSRGVLDALASVALRCDRFSIEIAGHTDNQGARDVNMTLSRARAEAVRSYLAEQGVARSRMIAAGYGPDRPRASNATEAGQAANRRIEFNVTG